MIPSYDSADIDTDFISWTDIFKPPIAFTAMSFALAIIASAFI